MDQNFSSFEYDNYQDFTHVLILMQCFIHVKSISRKNMILLFEKFPFLVLAKNMIMLPHLIIHFLLHYLSTGRLREVKNKGKFQTFSYKRGRNHLEVVAYKSFQIKWFDMQTFGILENLSLRRGGHLREVVTPLVGLYYKIFQWLTRWPLETTRLI